MTGGPATSSKPWVFDGVFGENSTQAQASSFYCQSFFCRLIAVLLLSSFSLAVGRFSRRRLRAETSPIHKRKRIFIRNTQVYEAVAEHILGEVLKGFHGCIMARRENRKD